MRVLASTLLLLLTACGGPPVDKSGRVPAIMALTPSTPAGGEVYAATCAGCHGPEGQGKMGPALGASVAALETSEVATIAINGYGLMGPAGAKLTDQQVADLASWVKNNLR